MGMIVEVTGGARKGFSWHTDGVMPTIKRGPFKSERAAWTDAKVWLGRNKDTIFYDTGTLKDGRRYLAETPPHVPDGKVLCHNRVLPAEPLGLHGFRAWTMPHDPNRLRRCYCGWAPHLKHYAWRGLEHKQPVNVRTFETDIEGNPRTQDGRD
jgi:hypothetical protein